MKGGWVYLPASRGATGLKGGWKGVAGASTEGATPNPNPNQVGLKGGWVLVPSARRGVGGGAQGPWQGLG